MIEWRGQRRPPALSERRLERDRVWTQILRAKGPRSLRFCYAAQNHTKISPGACISACLPGGKSRSIPRSCATRRGIVGMVEEMPCLVLAVPNGIWVDAKGGK